MERKRFLELLAALPLIGAPLRVIGIAPEPATCKTQSDVEGPFYRSGAPIRPVIETSGSPLRIEGTIFSRDCKTPVADATLDIWHCDNEGNYDMRGFKGRGQVRTDANGHYVFTTIFPPPYGTFKSAVKWNEHIWNGILTFYQLDLIQTQKWNERYTENIVT